MRAEVDVRPVRARGRARARSASLRALPWRAIATRGGAGLAVLALAVGVFLAGSSGHIAAGVRVAGMKVAGQTPAEAVRALERAAARYRSVPVVLTDGGRSFSLRPSDLDARVDWTKLAADAQAKGNWPMPFRGLKRAWLLVFGADVVPVADVYEPRLEFEVARIAKRLDRPGRDAAIVLTGLDPHIVPDRDGRTLARDEAADVVRRSVAGFDRAPVALPVRTAPSEVTADDLEPVLVQVERALSASVRFGWNDAHWLVQPRELAGLLRLPADGRRVLEIGGSGADRYFGTLARAVNRKARNASFAIADNGRVRIVPGAKGRVLDVPATAKALLAAALSIDRREAELVVREIEPKLTTKRARALGVTRVLSSYSTAYSGTADRIRNLRLAVSLLDGTTLAPGATFSFNEVVGPRTAKRGFRIAPTIVDGEYKDAVGGGVSQVATTVFNAAWEAGLKITARSGHSLFISRYPLGRDATVNYPDVDLRFVNDTKDWLVVRGRSSDAGIEISLLGGAANRRVVSDPGELRETSPPEVETVPDPTLHVGEDVVVDAGEPARAIAVRRTVYERGRMLYDETWYTTYLSEAKILRVGTIPLPVPKEEPKEPPPALPTAPGGDEPAAPPTPPAPPAPPPSTTSPTSTTAPNPRPR
ncbi:MAG: VanW family protein [Thermoleophilia bacterium]|nr:VanW family protein [Thermoleophilia bacterium]